MCLFVSSAFFRAVFEMLQSYCTTSLEPVLPSRGSEPRCPFPTRSHPNKMPVPVKPHRGGATLNHQQQPKLSMDDPKLSIMIIQNGTTRQKHSSMATPASSTSAKPPYVSGRRSARCSVDPALMNFWIDEGETPILVTQTSGFEEYAMETPQTGLTSIH